MRITDWKNAIRALVFTTAVVAGVVGAHQALAGDCCSEGAPCCKPGAPCCNGKHLAQR